MDFNLERLNGMRTAANFRGNDLIAVPETMGELSSKRVLTMEFVEGLKVRGKDRLISNMSAR